MLVPICQVYPPPSCEFAVETHDSFMTLVVRISCCDNSRKKKTRSGFHAVCFDASPASVAPSDDSMDDTSLTMDVTGLCYYADSLVRRSH